MSKSWSGWTSEKCKHLIGDSKNDAPVKVNRKNQKRHEDHISNALTIAKIPHVREYKFHETRRFRFDIAIPEHKIAIEYEGGIFTGGDHNRGKRYARDCRKYNLGVLSGWKILRYTTADTNKSTWAFKVVDDVRTLIKRGENEDDNN